MRDRRFVNSETRNLSMRMSSRVDDYPLDSSGIVDFSKIKVGAKTLEDAILDLGNYQKVDKRLARREAILKSLYDNDYAEMREISKFYFETSGIYSRLCKYMAYMYRYD